MTKKQSNFYYGQDTMTAGSALEIARGDRKGVIGEASQKRIKESKQAVDDIVSGSEVVYGVNTGFGPLCTTVISESDTKKLQHNILKSHSVGVGEPIPREIAKLMLILKLHSLAQGFSGVSMATLERIQWHIEQEVIPLVPAQGSVGASGDLAPLAHLFLPLIGLGQVFDQGKLVPTEKIFQKENISQLSLGPKEGLALINGTQFILAYAVKVVEKLQNCLSHADIISALMIEALLGSSKPFIPELHQLRPFKGNLHVAHRVNYLLKGSDILHSHADCERVQDPYSLRCIPQVHGASRNAWLHLKELVEIELNSVTDNPIILNKDQAISGGNFHGQPLALPLDYAAVAAAELGNISDRRIYLSLEGEAEGLPKLLMKHTGINSGFMLPQYTSAALVSENKALCFPASADSIPTSLGQEDHVSMGSISGRKTYQIIDNLENILAIELLCAAQAFDFRTPLKSGKLLEACHGLIRSRIDHVEEDRVFAKDIAKARKIIADKELTAITDKLAEMEHQDFKSNYHELFEVY